MIKNKVNDRWYWSDQMWMSEKSHLEKLARYYKENELCEF
jgi:hypothetical protein